MLRANNPLNQGILDRRFSELCAEQSLTPVVNTVQVNEETLIALAHHTASVKHANELLQKQVQKLQEDIAKLTASLSSTPGTFFNNNKTTEENVGLSDIKPSTNM